MPDSYVNKHDRKPGRGLRPWLLIPKVLAVCCYFGSLVTMLVLWFTLPQPIQPLRAVHAYLTVPSLLAAVLLGGALVIHHGAVLLRMRWLMCKIVLAVTLLFVHVWLAKSLTTAAMITAIVIAIVVIWLGRHKPRLGQNIASIYRKSAV